MHVACGSRDLWFDAETWLPLKVADRRGGRGAGEAEWSAEDVLEIVTLEYDASLPDPRFSTAPPPSARVIPAGAMPPVLAFGRPVPNWTARLDGKGFDLAQLKGSATLVVPWAGESNLEEIQGLQERWGDRLKVLVVVTWQASPAARKLIAEDEHTFLVVVDHRREMVTRWQRDEFMGSAVLLDADLKLTDFLYGWQ